MDLDSVNSVVRFFRLTDVGHRRRSFMVEERETLIADFALAAM